MISSTFLLDLVTSGADQNSLYHKAFKKVNHVDTETWEDVTPSKENAYKFELFLHNFMPKIPEGKLGVLMVDRNTEFAPVKNANGDPNADRVKDSPAMAAHMVLMEHQTWLTSVQGLNQESGAVQNTEVSPLLSYAGENLNWLKHIFKKSPILAPGGNLAFNGTFSQAIDK